MQDPADRTGWVCDKTIRMDVDVAVASFIRWIEFESEIAFIVLFPGECDLFGDNRIEGLVLDVEK